MNNYEKRIGLKSIYLTFVRHFMEMLIIFVPIAIVSVVVIKGFIKPSYSSSVTFSKSTVFATAHYENLIKNVKDDNLLKEAIDSLPSIKHNNGNNITIEELKKSIYGPKSYTNNASSNIKISLEMAEKGLAQPFLEKITEFTVKKMKTETGEWSTFSASSASADIKNDSSKKYLLIALAADLVLSLGVPFIFEIVGDQVYDKDDISYLGCSGFELNASKVSK